MPTYLPYHLELVFISGVFEVLGGLGLFVPKLNQLSVFGLLALLIAVYPANINMAMHPEITPEIPVLLMYFRLPLQFLLMYWVWTLRNESKRISAKAED